MNENVVTDRLMKTAELADRLGMALPRAYALARLGEFDAFMVKIGPKPVLRFRPDGLADYIAKGGRLNADRVAV